MFSELALFAAASMAVFVVALPHPGGGGSTNNSCNGGTVQCCQSYQSASSAAVQDKAGKLGLLPVDILGPTSVPVGLTCTPISVLAADGLDCTSQQACCTGNTFHGGALALGCTPDPSL